MTVNAHPHKQFVESLVGVQYVRCTNFSLATRKTDRFMMSYAVTENVDSIEFVEDIGIIVLDFR